VITMTAKNSHDAGREARHDRQAHPERPSRHESAMRTYLAGLAYAETHDRPDTPEDDDDHQAGDGSRAGRDST
jgi:hypothetical protein